MHELTAELVAARYNLEALAKADGELRDRINHLESIVEQMTKADEIAAAVVEAQHADRRQIWTTTRVIIATVAGARLALPAIDTVTDWLHH